MLRIAAFRSLVRSNEAVVMVVSPKLVCGTSAGIQPAALWRTTATDATRTRPGEVWRLARTGARRPRPASGPRPFGHFRMVNVVPDLLLGEIKKAGQHDEKHEHLEAEPLALVEFRLRRPHQKG